MSLPSSLDKTSKSHTICGLISGSVAFRHATHIGIFHPREHEVDLLSLWEKQPHKCVFPRVARERLIFFLIETLNDLHPGFVTILEPQEGKSLEVKLRTPGDLILVPGLVFDRRGGRIGSGLGFYDRFLSTLPKGVHKWGVCWASHLTKDELAQTRTDVRMDAIVTEDGIMGVDKSSDKS